MSKHHERTTYAFLPGASGRGDFWEPVSMHLSDATCLHFDWPGFGDVPAEPDRALNGYDDLATLVIERLERLERLEPLGHPTVLVGQSMGGVVAALVVARRPDLVSHLVLAVTSGGIDVESLGAQDWRPGSSEANPDNPSWMWDDRPETTETLRTLAIPTLLIWATEDPISPLRVGMYLRQLIPGSRLVTFESDDHWVARIHADRVAHEIRGLAGGDSYFNQT